MINLESLQDELDLSRKRPQRKRDKQPEKTTTVENKKPAIIKEIKRLKFLEYSRLNSQRLVVKKFHISVSYFGLVWNEVTKSKQ